MIQDVFGSKILEHNGLGERTCFSPTLFAEKQLGEATRMASRSVIIIRHSS